MTVFDRRNGYLTIFFGMPKISVNVTYFAGVGKDGGVIFYLDRTDQDAWTSHVFQYADGRWNDVSERYLAPLRLSSQDFFLAPEYGRTGRILSYFDGKFRHKE